LAGLAPLLLLWLMAALALRVPIHRAASRLSFNYNEGWNSYWAGAVLEGKGVYASPPGYTVANYPPLWFHLLASAKGAFGGVNPAGRWIELAALLAAAGLAGFAAARQARSWRAGAVAAPLMVLSVAAVAPQYIAMNDPQMLAHALLLAGVAAYLCRGESLVWICASAVLCCLGLFVKHTLVAFPSAVILHLALTNRRRAMVWISTAGLTAALLTWWIFARDGAYFIPHLVGPRTYSATAAAAGLLACLYLCGLVTLAGVFAAYRLARNDRRHLFVLMLAFGLVEALAVGGASGVASNVAFDAVFALCMLAGVGSASMPNRPLLAAVVPILLGACFLPAGHPVLHPGAAGKIENLARAERDYTNDLAYVRGIPGPALCEDLLLCYEAGKPLLYEPFNAAEYIRAGRSSAQPVVEDLRAHRYAVLVLERPASDRFPPEVRAAVEAHYRVERQSAVRVFLQPANE
jgi:hypothetical protein